MIDDDKIIKKIEKQTNLKHKLYDMIKV